jgi:hypothetical protein
MKEKTLQGRELIKKKKPAKTASRFFRGVLLPSGVSLENSQRLTRKRQEKGIEEK